MDNSTEFIVCFIMVISLKCNADIADFVSWYCSYENVENIMGLFCEDGGCE